MLKNYANLALLALLKVLYLFTTQAFSPMNTIAISSGGKICGIMGDGTQSLICGGDTAKPPQGSFFGIVAGEDFFCALDQNSRHPICWTVQGVNFPMSNLTSYASIAAGRSMACGIADHTRHMECWNISGKVQVAEKEFVVDEVTVGGGFICAVHSKRSNITCWGDYKFDVKYEDLKGMNLSSISGGENHVCFVVTYNMLGLKHQVRCWGLSVKAESLLRSLVSGDGFVCGLDIVDGELHCLFDDSNDVMESSIPRHICFSILAASKTLICGLATYASSRIACFGKQTALLPLVPLNSGFCRATCNPDETDFSNSSFNLCQNSLDNLCISCSQNSCEALHPQKHSFPPLPIFLKVASLILLLLVVFVVGPLYTDPMNRIGFFLGFHHKDASAPSTKIFPSSDDVFKKPISSQRLGAPKE